MSANQDHGHAGHRLETLTDGIYAVAMTLLVIDLKVPEGNGYDTSMALAQAVADLFPHFIAWVMSFFVLALFWYGHHRVFTRVHHPDGKLVALTIIQLALVSLMPFSSALSGGHVRLLLAQCIYSANMALLALTALLIARHIHRHADRSAMSMTDGIWRGVRLRTGALMACSLLAIGLGMLVPGLGNAIYLLMAPVMRWSRRMEA